MNIYIYEYVDDLTSAYHDDGGLVIITDRDPLEVFNEKVRQRADPLPEPAAQYSVPTETERVFVFPDAGCC